MFGLLLLLEAGRSQIISTQAPTQPLATMSATCAEKRGVDLESGMTLYKEFPKLYYNVSLSGDKHVSIYIDISIIIKHAKYWLKPLCAWVSAWATNFRNSI